MWYVYLALLGTIVQILLYFHKFVLRHLTLLELLQFASIALWGTFAQPQDQSFHCHVL